MSKKVTILLLLLLIFLPAARGYYFGTNKVRYHVPEWQVYETDHFKVHLYGPWNDMAEEICRICEEAFLKVTVILQHTPRKKIPLFVYDSEIDFWGTNITDAPLGPGVGGFTESLKNRVVIPVGASLQAFESVVTHEVAHAVQFSILYGDDMRAFQLLRSIFVPTWVMEGTAEYCAEDWDATGEMVLRQAVLAGETIPPDKLDSFTLLGDKVYLGYKQSQSLVDYIAAQRGRSKIALLIKGYTKQMSADQIIDEIFSDERDELVREKRSREKLRYKFNDLCRDWLRQKQKEYWRQVSELEIEGMEKQVLRTKQRKSGRATTPRWSPDGNCLAFFARQGADTRLKLYYPARGKERTVFKGRRYQVVRTDSLSWSADGTCLALAALKGDAYLLVLVSVEGGVEERRIGKGQLRQPCFSPDGGRIAFIDRGSENGDLYVYHLASGTLLALTPGEARDSSPFWRCDESICFIRVDEEGSAFMQISAAGGEASELYRDGNMKRSAAFSPDGKSIVYVSDVGGVPNVFSLELEKKKMMRLSAVQGGAFSPSVSPDGKLVAFSEYMGRASKLCVVRVSAGVVVDPRKESVEDIAARVVPASARKAIETRRQKNGGEVLRASALLTPMVELEELEADGSSAHAADHEKAEEPADEKAAGAPALPAQLTMEASNRSVLLSWQAPQEDAPEVKHYRIYRRHGEEGWRQVYETVSPEATSFVDRELENGEQYEYMVVAVNAAGASLPSDIVKGVPQLNISQHPYDIDMSTDLVFLLLSYDARAGVVGMGFYRTSDMLGNHRLSLYMDSLPDVRRGGRLNYQYLKHRLQMGLDFYYMENQYYVYDFYNNAIHDQLWEDVFGGELMAEYPLDLWHRLEVGFSSRKVSGGLRSEGVLFERDITKDLLVLGVINSVSCALVRERVSFHGMEEVNGTRGKLGTTFASSYLGGTASFNNYFFDYEIFRALWALEQPLVGALRLFGVNSVGHNRVKVYSGGVDTIRGFGYASFASSMVCILNAEIRTPLLPNLHLALWPLNFFVLDEVRLALFYDLGILADRFHEVSRRSTVQGAGIGFRFYCYLFARQPLILRLEIARPIDREAEERYQFSLGRMF